jgi:CDGSH-type Zn-finger protein
MSEVVIKARENGPLLVTGPFKLVDHLGNVFDLTGKESVALCRCGQSGRKPFCDGTHRACGFVAGETAPPPPSPLPA